MGRLDLSVENSMNALSSLADLCGTPPTLSIVDGCTSSANNTGERAKFFDALLWAQRQVGDELFIILYGSLYVANITCGVWKPKSNKGIATLCIDTPQRENERRKAGVHVIHMSKVTPNNVGNEKLNGKNGWPLLPLSYQRHLRGRLHRQAWTI